jgi:hypothetical protein
MSDLEFQKDAVDAFVAGSVWKRIVEDALTRGLLLSEDNDLLDPFAEPSTIAKNQGEIKALKWLVDLPRIYKEELDEQPKPKEGDNNE